MKAPILILADAHLRGGGEAQSAMLRFLSAQRADDAGLVILGDLFDYLAGVNPHALRAYRPVLDALARYRKIVYIEGNHDFDLEPASCGLPRARVFPGPTRLELGGKLVLLMHGDRCDPADLGTRALRAALQSRPVRWLRDEVLPGGALFRFALAFARASRSRTWPGRRDEAAAVERRAAAELRRGGLDAVLFAHTHRPLLRRTASGILANPGPAVPGGSYLAIESPRIQLRAFPDGALLQELPWGADR
ncbi:MAG: metallophosphoesterase [Deltaproteobacteria bacterium]|nr:metallophosphoesterase [Deltaproteobacteria bacterium]